MKINRRTILSTAAVLGVAALVAGGTIAYFTDKEEAENSFSVGNVDIELYESQLHRQNSGREGNFSALASDQDYCDWTSSQTVADKGDMDSYFKARYCTPGKNLTQSDTSDLSAVAAGHIKSGTWGYSDTAIRTDAGTYEMGYFARVSQNIVPGQYVRKFAYVENKAENNGSDAYVLVRYMVPKAYADNIDLDMPSTAFVKDINGGSVTNGNGYFTLVERYDSNSDSTLDKYRAVTTVTNKETLKNYKGYEETVGGITYKIYAAVTTSALKPGEMTFWSPVNTIKLSENAQNTTSTASTYVNYADQIDVKVDAQAIQARTFSDAIEAINAL